MGKIKNAVKSVAVGSAKIGASVVIPGAAPIILATDACKVAKKITGKDCGKIGTAAAIVATIVGTS